MLRFANKQLVVALSHCAFGEGCGLRLSAPTSTREVAINNRPYP
jgi:hypothetical protein